MGGALKARWRTGVFFTLLIAATPSGANQIDLTHLSIEQLMDVEVELASRKPQRISDIAAAISVLTDEDLRHSAVRTIPDALRVVPSLQVAGVDANKWVVTARGFNGLFANKLLVQIDGRTVYTPLFSRVFWESQDIVLADVDRIEVIRGPGGTMWGANAVNGIVNVVTKSAAKTPGLLLEVGAGLEEERFGTIRYGRRLTKEMAVRWYAKYLRRDASVAAGDHRVQDGWDVGRAGLRMDWAATKNDELTLISNAYRGTVGQGVSLVSSPSEPFDQPVYADAEINGQDVLGRWHRKLHGESAVTLQLYVDRAERTDVRISGVVENADLDFQHRSQPIERHDLVWGLGYRRTNDDFKTAFPISLTPRSRRVQLFNGFLQDQITLIPQKLRLAAGSKLEHNDYSGFGVQPSLRLWWSPQGHHVFWTSLSRALRTPSRAENDIRAIVNAIPAGSLYDGSPVGLVELRGSREFESETVRAFDIGYRSQFGNRLLFDLAGFQYSYAKLRTNEVGAPVQRDEPAPHVLLPIIIGNDANGETAGIESSLEWRPTLNTRLQLGYTYLHMKLNFARDDIGGFAVDSEKDSPTQQIVVRTSADLFRNTHIDLIARYVDEIPLQNISDYLALDIRFALRTSETTELSVVSRNLLAGSHAEYISSASGTLPAKVQASLFAVLQLRL